MNIAFISLEGYSVQSRDSELDNIWGKFYIYLQSASACATGYHVPSDLEWEEAEEYLYDQQNLGTAPNNCRNTSDGWKCPGIGWKLHSTTNSTNNLALKLGLPLSGIRSTTNSFVYRGLYTTLWSTTEDPSDPNLLRNRLFGANENIMRGLSHQNNGLPVRCIKD